MLENGRSFVTATNHPIRCHHYVLNGSQYSMLKLQLLYSLPQYSTLVNRQTCSSTIEPHAKVSIRLASDIEGREASERVVSGSQVQVADKRGDECVMA